MIDEIKAKVVSNSNFDGCGTNSVCHCIGEYALLYGRINKSNIAERKRVIDEYIKRGFNIAPILEYQFDNSKEIEVYEDGSSYQYGWTLQKRAIGEELFTGWDFAEFSSEDSFVYDFNQYKRIKTKYINALTRQASVKEEHLDKFIRDYLMIVREGKLFLDPSKSSNFFYDKDKGFTFIDVELISDLCKNPEYPEDYIPDICANLLFPVVPRMSVQEEKVKKGQSQSGVIPLTEEEYDLIYMQEMKLGKKLLDICVGNYGFHKQEVIEKISRKMYSSNKSRKVCKDEKVVCQEIRKILSQVITQNRQNGLNPENTTEQSDDFFESYR